MIAILAGCGTNITSVQFALERLGKTVCITDDAKLLQAASHVILPGVNTASRAMAYLQQHQLIDVIRQLTQPVLGICSGMQILYQHSQEGEVDGLAIFPGKIAALPADKGLTLPHMGWNQLQIHDVNSPLVQGIADQSYVYFVHGYALPMTPLAQTHTIASACYGIPFAAMVNHKNFYGVQFHPERSGAVGEKILQNFLTLS